MKRSLRMACTIGAALLLSGCSWFGGNSNKVDPSTNDNSNGMQQEGQLPSQQQSQQEYRIDDVVSQFNQNGIDVTDTQTITEFDFAAHEGKSFKIDDQMFYLYRMDGNQTDIQSLYQDIDATGKMKVKQNGTEKYVSAYRNRDFVMIYPDSYDISRIKAIMDKVFE